MGTTFPVGTIVKLKNGSKIRTVLIVQRYHNDSEFLALDAFSELGKQAIAALGNPEALRALAPKVGGHRERFYDSQVTREVGKSELQHPEAWGLK